MGKSLTDEEFIEIWQRSQNVKEVLVRTGFVYSRVIARAHSLRKEGYDLKKFPKSTKGGGIPNEGIMMWLKANYPQVYQEWKEASKPGKASRLRKSVYT